MCVCWLIVFVLLHSCEIKYILVLLKGGVGQFRPNLQVSVVLSQFTLLTERRIDGRTDRHTDTFLMAIPCRSLHYMQSQGR